MIALVLAAADCLFEDLEEIAKLVPVEHCLIVAVNDAGVVYPGKIDHWVTMHPEELEWRKIRRQENGYPDGFETWTRPYPFGMKDREDKCDHLIGGFNGSSGLVGVGVGLEVADVAIGCGLPMDNRPHIATGKRWEACVGYRDRWIELRPLLSKRFRSVSGWTMEQFGPPTAEWLESHISYPLAEAHTTAGVDHTHLNKVE